MAEKHKSKYKAPKDFEKSLKTPTRKDLKDYTHDDKDGGMNPKSAGDKQTNVLRKTDKEVVDDGKYDIKYNDDDRLYKSIEDGEYDPKTAAKRLKKRQDNEEKETKDVLKDKIENLTREGKERLVREYPEADAAAASPEPEAAPTPAAAPAPDATATQPAEQEPGPDERQTLNVSKIKDVLSSERSNLSRIETLFRAIDQTFQDADPIDIKNFYRLMLRTIAKKYKKIGQSTEE
jgi:hypothetical protein